MDFRAAFSNMKKGIPMKRKKWNDVWYYDKSKKILMGKHDSGKLEELFNICLLYTSPSPRDRG